MSKKECERVTRQFIHRWLADPYAAPESFDDLKFCDFESWLCARGYGAVIDQLRRWNCIDEAPRWLGQAARLH